VSRTVTEKLQVAKLLAVSRVVQTTVERPTEKVVLGAGLQTAACAATLSAVAGSSKP
jgi:hypothetical protein